VKKLNSAGHGADAAVAIDRAPAMAKTTIKCQQCYSSKLPGLGTASVWMSQMVKEATDGIMNHQNL
jgi:TRAP-type mannitol/chloroaromatic compound transport system substrate-binding protein